MLKHFGWVNDSMDFEAVWFVCLLMTALSLKSPTQSRDDYSIDKCDDLQLLSVSYHRRLSVFGFWAVEQTKQAI